MVDAIRVEDRPVESDTQPRWSSVAGPGVRWLLATVLVGPTVGDVGIEPWQYWQIMQNTKPFLASTSLIQSESSDLGQCNHSVARLITSAATSIVGNHFFKPVQSAWANFVLASTAERHHHQAQPPH
jgi:hypothetical protein